MLLRTQGGNSSAVLIAFVRSSDGAFVWQASQLTGAHSELTPAPDNATAARAQEFEQVRDELKSKIEAVKEGVVAAKEEKEGEEKKNESTKTKSHEE